MSTNIERLKKLKALALHGAGGEREQAEALLAKLMKKYECSFEDLDEEIKAEHKFTFKGEFERKLFNQVVYKVLDESGKVYRKRWVSNGKLVAGELYVECTEAQKVEIEFLFDFYKRLLEKELDFFFSCFIQKHAIFGNLKEGEKGTQLSKEENFRMGMIMRGLSDETPLAAITEG